MTTETTEQDQQSSNEGSLGQILAGKYMCFRLGSEEYALDILRVQELLALLEITRVPGTESYVRGVMNLRGTVIPVVDLRLKVGMQRAEPTKHTVIIVARFDLCDRQATIGALVDRVVGVTDIAPEQIDEVPELSLAAFKRDSIRGVARIDGRVVFLLDVAKALAPSTRTAGLTSAASVMA